MRYTRDAEARSAAARKKRTRTIDDVFKLAASREAKAARKTAAEQAARALPNAERIAAKIRSEAEKKRR